MDRAARNTQTLTTGNQDSDVMATASHMYFQVVDTGLVWKKHVDSEVLAAWRRMSCPAMVQNMRVWHGGRSAEDCATVYQDGWPEPVDVMMLAAWPDLSKGSTVWTATQISDVKGCIQLGAPVKAHRQRWSA